MRILCAALAACLITTAVSAETLPSGRPAGVAGARLRGWDQALLVGTGAAILAGVAILASGQSSALNTTRIDSAQVPFTPPSTAVSTGTR